MPFEIFVALRFLREGRAQTALILAGATVGVAVIVFLTALIGGLQATLLEKTLSSQPHVTLRRPDRVARVLPPEGGEALLARVERTPERTRSVDRWQDALAAARAAPGVRAASPVASGAAFAARAEASRPVTLRGIEPASGDAVVPISPRVVRGAWRVEGGDAVIGAGLAAELGLGPGDKLRLSTPEGRSEIFTVSAVFDLGNKEVNDRWVMVALRAAQTLLDLSGGVTGIELKAEDPFDAEALAAGLAGRTGLEAESWMQVNRELLTALRSQSASSWMIQAFVVLAVALGIASVLGVSVIQRSREIGILKAVGTSTPAVTRIFLVQGAVVGLVGSCAGGLLGALLGAAFQRAVKNPYGDALFRIELTPALFLGAGAVALATGIVSAVFPARRAATLDPATVIRRG